MNIEDLKLAIKEGTCPSCGGEVAKTRTVFDGKSWSRYDCTDFEDCRWSSCS